ncbi:MAG TPA: hypothetical protein VMS22_05870, partial [Candidatus Eisenbacteria bacterium]|nr:hypothetical protein [Candidatus Eisenbacteria bacterium]
PHAAVRLTAVAPARYPRGMRLFLAAILTLSIGARATCAQPHPTIPGSTWHAKSISGSALLFIVDEIGVHFRADGTFTATARFLDGQTTQKNGTYVIGPGGSLTLTVPGLGKPQRVHYYEDVGTLVMQDPGFGVSLRLQPGPMKRPSWF